MWAHSFVHLRMDIIESIGSFALEPWRHSPSSTLKAAPSKLTHFAAMAKNRKRKGLWSHFLLQGIPSMISSLPPDLTSQRFRCFLIAHCAEDQSFRVSLWRDIIHKPHRAMRFYSAPSQLSSTELDSFWRHGCVRKWPESRTASPRPFPITTSYSSA